MTTTLFAVPAYLLGTFILSALLVRFAPKAHSSRQVRKHLSLFMVLPLTLVVDILMSIDAIRRFGMRAVRGAFELISGRLHSSDEYAYAYFGYSRRRQNCRRSDRRARALGTVGKVASAKA